MSRRLISRRHFLGLPLTFLLAPHVAWPARGWAATTSDERTRTYTADVGILYGLLSFRPDGRELRDVPRAAEADGQRGPGRRRAAVPRRAGPVRAQGGRRPGLRQAHGALRPGGLLVVGEKGRARAGHVRPRPASRADVD